MSSLLAVGLVTVELQLDLHHLNYFVNGSIPEDLILLYHFPVIVETWLD